MVITNGADGSSIKNAIKIIDAETQKEAALYIRELAERIINQRGFDSYKIMEIKDGIFHSGYAVVNFYSEDQAFDSMWFEISRVFELESGWNE